MEIRSVVTESRPKYTRNINELNVLQRICDMKAGKITL